jgi:hypothetical protein
VGSFELTYWDNKVGVIVKSNKYGAKSQTAPEKVAHAITKYHRSGKGVPPVGLVTTLDTSSRL